VRDLFFIAAPADAWPVREHFHRVERLARELQIPEQELLLVLYQINSAYGKQYPMALGRDGRLLVPERIAALARYIKLGFEKEGQALKVGNVVAYAGRLSARKFRDLKEGQALLAELEELGKEAMFPTTTRVKYRPGEEGPQELPAPNPPAEPPSGAPREAVAEKKPQEKKPEEEKASPHPQEEGLPAERRAGGAPGERAPSPERKPPEGGVDVLTEALRVLAAKLERVQGTAEDLREEVALLKRRLEGGEAPPSTPAPGVSGEELKALVEAPLSELKGRINALEERVAALEKGERAKAASELAEVREELQRLREQAQYLAQKVGDELKGFRDELERMAQVVGEAQSSVGEHRAVAERVSALGAQIEALEEKLSIFSSFLHDVIVQHLLKDAVLGYVRVGRNLQEVPILTEEAIEILERLVSKAPPIHTPPEKYDRWWRRLFRRKG